MKILMLIVPNDLMACDVTPFIFTISERFKNLFRLNFGSITDNLMTEISACVSMSNFDPFGLTPEHRTTYSLK